MENDLLSVMTMNDSMKSLASKLFRLALVLMILNVLYSLIDLFEWYSFLRGSRTSGLQSPYYFYYHAVRPAVAFSMLALSMIAQVINYKAYRAINTGIQLEDAAFVNKGFKNIYTGFLLTIIFFCIAILSIGYRYFIMRGAPF